MRRIAVIAVAAALVAAAPADGAWRDLRVGSSQRSVDASAGSGCGTNANGSGGCADAAYPLALRGTLFVRRGHAVAFDFSQPVDRVSISTPHGEIPVRREWNGTRWIGTVPEALPDGLVRIGVGSAWDGGDQHFEAGLHVIRRGRAWVRVPDVVGPQIDAMLALERRGLRWRFERGGPRFHDSGPPIPPLSAPALGKPVRGQSIRPGKRVRRGTAVLLRL